MKSQIQSSAMLQIDVVNMKLDRLMYSFRDIIKYFLNVSSLDEIDNSNRLCK